MYAYIHCQHAPSKFRIVGPQAAVRALRRVSGGPAAPETLPGSASIVHDRRQLGIRFGAILLTRAQHARRQRRAYSCIVAGRPGASPGEWGKVREHVSAESF